MTVIRRGAASLLDTEIALWPRGISYPGFPNMFLEDHVIKDRGPVAEVSLNFLGYLTAETPRNGLVEKSTDVSLASVEIVPSGQDDAVTFSYYAKQTIFRWIQRGGFEPQAPRFRSQVSSPSAFPDGFLYAASPPNFSGSIGGKYRPVLRLTQFSPQEVARTLWTVTETWSIEVEAT